LEINHSNKHLEEIIPQHIFDEEITIKNKNELKNYKNNKNKKKYTFGEIEFPIVDTDELSVFTDFSDCTIDVANLNITSDFEPQCGGIFVSESGYNDSNFNKNKRLKKPSSLPCEQGLASKKSMLLLELSRINNKIEKNKKIQIKLDRAQKQKKIYLNLKECLIPLYLT